MGEVIQGKFGTDMVVSNDCEEFVIHPWDVESIHLLDTVVDGHVIRVCESGEKPTLMSVPFFAIVVEEGTYIN